MEIRDSVIVITGASSGIGAATARAASLGGARLVLAARREGRVRDLSAELDRATAVRCDVTDQAQVDSLVRAGSLLRWCASAMAVRIHVVTAQA